MKIKDKIRNAETHPESESKTDKIYLSGGYRSNGKLQNKDRFEYIETDLIEESETNPRRKWDETAMQELTESIKLYGVIQPIVVRDAITCYELVSGARRLRAAISAGLKTIPAVIKKLTDEQVLEIQVIENLQRKDIDPLEESECFVKLINSEKYTVQTIADKIGKSLQYVYSRIRLSKLIDEVKVLFENGKINFASADIFSRMPDYQQEEIYNKYGGNGDSMDAESIKSDLRAYSMLPNLKRAPFKITDSNLVASAGACINCLKNTGCDTQLFPDMSDKQICTDKKCYEEKVNTHIKNKMVELDKKHVEYVQISEKYWEDKSGEIIPANKYTTCKKNDEGAVTAIVVRTDFNTSENLGKVKYIQIDNKKPISKSTEDKLAEATVRGKKIGRIMALESFTDYFENNNNIEDAFNNPEIIIGLCKIVRQNIGQTTFAALRKYYLWDVAKGESGCYDYYKRFDELFEKHSRDVKYLLNLLLNLILFREVEIFYNSDEDLLTKLCKTKGIELQDIVKAQVKEETQKVLIKYIRK